MGDDLLDLAPGTVLAGTPYRVLRRLGGGGMGAVFEGEHVRLRKRRVCIKTVHPGLRGRNEYLERMEIEGQTLARLDHPGIVRVFDLGVTDDGIPFFVMERLEGKDLRKLLQAKRFFELRDALTVAEDVLLALAHAHREGVVHRDIKPENIFLAVSDAETVTKVLDFGIAQVADDRRGLTGQRFLGTCQYASPEQLRGEPVTEKSDLYAMGCVLFELVTGRRPFPGPGTAQYVQQHLNETPPRLSSLVAVPKALDELVASALAKDPEKRPISALWFASQLHQIVQTAEGASLATANTTQEMLLTAVTEAAPSSPQLVAAGDTLQDPALPAALRSTTPVGPGRTAPIGGRGDTVPLADPRRAPTRTSAPAPPRAATEELTPEEHAFLEGYPVESEGERALSTGGKRLEASYEIPKDGWLGPRASNSNRKMVVALPIVVSAAVAVGILIGGSARDADRPAPPATIPSAIVTATPPTVTPEPASAAPVAPAAATAPEPVASPIVSASVVPSAPPRPASHAAAAVPKRRVEAAAPPPAPSASPAATSAPRAPATTSPAPTSSASPPPRDDLIREM